MVCYGMVWYLWALTAGTRGQEGRDRVRVRVRVRVGVGVGHLPVAQEGSRECGIAD